MQFIDLQRQYQRLKPGIDHRLQQVLSHGQFIMGPEVKELETKLAKYVGVKHCIGVGNGTDALLLALMALEIGPGDEVITSPFSFISAVEMAMLLGAKPIFVDIKADTYNLDPQLLAAAITPKTKAIVPVNLYGQCADYDVVNAIAAQHKIPVIEDAAQSFGAKYKGRQSGSLGAIGCVSFFPSKPLGGYGDGGACFTDDDILADRLRKLANHGQSSRYHHVLIGINSRLDSLQAAILLEKLTILDEELQLRQAVANQYQTKLAKFATVPTVLPHNFSAYAQYTVGVDCRDEVLAAFKAAQIPTAVHYPVAIHKQPALAQQGHFPQAELASRRVLSLPFHPYLGAHDIDTIAETLATAVNTAAVK